MHTAKISDGELIVGVRIPLGESVEFIHESIHDDDGNNQLIIDECDYFRPYCRYCCGTGASDIAGKIVCQSCKGTGDWEDSTEE